jgi:hypothetical protein
MPLPDRVLRAASPKVAEPLEKVLGGVDLELEEGLTLANVEGEDLNFVSLHGWKRSAGE